MPAEPQQWGIVGSLVVALLAVGRFLIRWERTFTDAARDEIVQLRSDIAELRGHVAKCEQDHERQRLRTEELTWELSVERWRVALLIRAMQEAGTPVPEAAVLRVTYDPHTNSYKVEDSP